MRGRLNDERGVEYMVIYAREWQEVLMGKGVDEF
jgi:hypothetical protein